MLHFLPNNVLLLLAFFLPVDEFFIYAQTCKKWRTIFKNLVFYRIGRHSFVTTFKVFCQSETLFALGLKTFVAFCSQCGITEKAIIMPKLEYHLNLERYFVIRARIKSFETFFVQNYYRTRQYIFVYTHSHSFETILNMNVDLYIEAMKFLQVINRKFMAHNLIRHCQVTGQFQNYHTYMLASPVIVFNEHKNKLQTIWRRSDDQYFP